MIKSILFLCLTIIGFNAISSAQEIVITDTFSSYEDALIISKEQNKQILLMFTGEHCSFCEKQKQVLFDKDVVKHLNNKVVCFVDISENKSIANKYNVKVVPTYFILDHQENVIKKNVGYKNKDKFIVWLN